MLSRDKTENSESKNRKEKKKENKLILPLEDGNRETEQ